MISIYSIITILGCHFIFDWLLQSDEIANNKGKYTDVLLKHVYTYSWGLILAIILNFNFFEHWYNACIWTFVNAVAHLFVDFVTAPATTALYRNENKRPFFNMIGMDQYIHQTILLTTFWYLT